METLNNTQQQSTTDSDNQALRRRAAYATLSQQQLTQPQLMEALWILEEEYKEAIEVTMVEFFLNITNRFNIDEKIGFTLFPTYHKYFKGSDGALPPDPMPMMVSFRGQSQASHSPASFAAGSGGVKAKMIVFDAVINNISTQISGNKDFSKFCGALKNEIGGAGLSGGSVNTMQAWCDSPGSSLVSATLGEKESAAIVHVVYLALCQIFGPVVADKQVARAIERVSLLPEADAFSPHALF